VLSLAEARIRLAALDRRYAELIDEPTRRATGGIYDRSAQWHRNAENRRHGRGKRRRGGERSQQLALWEEAA
jgi:hypothetical protein